MSGEIHPPSFFTTSSPTVAGTPGPSRSCHYTIVDFQKDSQPEQIPVLVHDRLPLPKSIAFYRIRSLNHSLARVARSASSFFTLAWWWLLLTLFLLLSSFLVAHRRGADASFLHPGPARLPERRSAIAIPQPEVFETLAAAADNLQISSRQEPESDKYIFTRLPKVITTPRVGCEDPMLPAAMVYTKVNGFDRREGWRDRVKRRSNGRLKPVFPVGLPITGDKEAIARGLAKEVAEYGDLLIGNFADKYSELPTKVIMSMQWFRSLCSLPTYQLKIDDDVAVNWKVVLEQIQEWTTRYQRREVTNDTRLWDLPQSHALVDKHWKWAPGLNYDMVEIPWWVGRVWQGMPVIHKSSHKNFEPGFPDLDWYPAFVAGPFYILHKEASAWMVDKRETDNRYFNPNDDAMLGLLANGTYLRPLNAFEIIPFDNPGYIEYVCGTGNQNVTECPCRGWWSIQASAKRRPLIEEYLGRCFPEKGH